MRHAQKVYRPVLLDVPEGPYRGTYEVHLGRPGAPRVYRRVGSDGLRRVGDPAAMEAVAQAYGVLLAAKRAEVARRRRLPYRWWRALGRRVADAWAALRRWLGRVRWVRTGLLP